jgi:hypothetical protein
MVSGLESMMLSLSNRRSELSYLEVVVVFLVQPSSSSAIAVARVVVADSSALEGTEGKDDRVSRRLS